MSYRFLLCLTFFFVCSSTFSDAKSSKHKSATNLIPFKSNEVKLKHSWLLEREKINLKYLYKLDADRLLHNFRVNAGIPSTAANYDGW